MRTIGGTVLVSLLLLSFIPAPLLAHANLKSSTPAAGAHLAQTPSQLRLDFSESVELAFTVVRLLTADGREVALGSLAFAPDSRRSVIALVRGAIDAGTYVVTWQVAGDDGHPVRGRYEFVVAPGAMGTSAAPGTMPGMHHDPVTMPEGSGFGADSPLYVVIRWMQFASLLIVIGTVSFRNFVLRILRRARDTEQAGGAAFVMDAERAAARLGLVATVALGATLVVRLFAQSYAMHGASGVLDTSVVGSMISQTTWGWGWLLQLAGVVLAALGFYRARGNSRDVLGVGVVNGSKTALWWQAATIGALAGAFAPAFSGHAASAPRLRALAIFADGLHVFAASSWLGTLTVLLMAGIGAGTQLSGQSRALVVRALVMAFSPVALASAGVAVVTGVFAAWLHVGTIPNLWSTRYGIILLVKLTVLGVVALTGFYNWKFVQPRLGTDEATVRLHRSAYIEVGVAIVVLLVTAVLVASPTSMDMVM